MTMADTIAVMNKGVIEQQGSPIDLYENPETPFVAGFLGMTNLLTATIITRGHEVSEVDFKGVRLQIPTRRIRTTGSAIEAGVRPEKIRLAAPDQHPVGSNAVQGTIFDVSFVGVSTQYFIKPTVDPIDHELTVFAQNDQAHRWRPGDIVTAWWDPEHTFGLREGSWVEAEAAEVAL